MVCEIVDVNTYDNSNYDDSIDSYKIYKITNMVTKLNYISYARTKYLSKVKEDLYRRPSKNFTLLFANITDKNDIMVELLMTLKSDNIYYVKQQIKKIEKDDKAIIKKCDLPIHKNTNKTDDDKNTDDSDDSDDKNTDDLYCREFTSVKDINESIRIEKSKEPKKKYIYQDKLCDKCNVLFTYKNFSRHYKSCNK